MTMQERYAAANAIEDSTRRNIALALLEAEHTINYHTKETETARAQIELMASQPSTPGYADAIEGSLRNWRLAYANLERAHYTQQLLIRLQDTPA